MKRVFLFLLVLAIGIVPVFSQYEKKINIGVEAGLNVSKFNASQCSNHLGLNVGLKAQYSLPSPLFLQSGVSFSVKGFKADAGYDEDYGNLDMSLWYLQVPLCFGYRIRINDIMDVSPVLGLYGAYAIKGDDGSKHSKDPFADYSDYGNENGVDDYRRYDYGLDGSVIFCVQRHLEFIAGYEFGLCNILDKDVKNVDAEYFSLDAKDSRNRLLYMKVAYIF